MKQVFLKSVFFTAMLLLLVSCLVPTSKDSYLHKFEDFVERVEQEHENYTKKDWKWADTQFRKFHEDWYEEYKDELSLAEKLNVKMLALKYKALKSGDVIDPEMKKRLKEDLKEEAEEMKNRINEYLEKDAEEDLEELKEGLEEIGDSAVKVFEEFLESIKKKDNYK